VRSTVPLQEFRITLDPGEQAVSGELVWTGALPPAEERPHFARSRRRVTEDYRRFDQIGTVRGRLVVDGEQVDIPGWWACRDHSWGVRPRIGVREPVTGPKVDLSERGFAMAFLFFSTDAHAGHVLFDRQGDDPGYVTGDVRRTDGAGPPAEVSGTDLEVDLHPGSRRFRSCVLSAGLDSGEELRFRCTASGPSIAMQGLGYSGGWTDRGGLGVWRGDRLEHDVWDVAHPSVVRYPDGHEDEHWHRIQPVAVEVEGAGPVGRGQGSMTLVLSGRLPWLGLS
jgi:hypothetical protein